MSCLIEQVFAVGRVHGDPVIREKTDKETGEVNVMAFFTLRIGFGNQAVYKKVKVFDNRLAEKVRDKIAKTALITVFGEPIVDQYFKKAGDEQEAVLSVGIKANDIRINMKARPKQDEEASPATGNAEVVEAASTLPDEGTDEEPYVATPFEGDTPPPRMGAAIDVDFETDHDQ